jgi:hypothetical protein
MTPVTFYCETCEEWRETVETAHGLRECCTCRAFILCTACSEPWHVGHGYTCEGEGADMRGYRVEVATTTVEVRYIRGHIAADEYAWNSETYSPRGARTVATVTRCEHENGYCESAPVVPNGLARMVRDVCEDCGETYDIRVQHLAEKVSRDPFYRPRVVTHYVEEWTDGEDDPYRALAHV